MASTLIQASLVDSFDETLDKIEKDVAVQSYWQTVTTESTLNVAAPCVMADLIADIGPYQLEVNLAIFSVVGQ